MDRLCFQWTATVFDFAVTAAIHPFSHALLLEPDCRTLLVTMATWVDQSVFDINYIQLRLSLSRLKERVVLGLGLDPGLSWNYAVHGLIFEPAPGLEPSCVVFDLVFVPDHRDRAFDVHGL